MTQSISFRATPPRGERSSGSPTLGGGVRGSVLECENTCLIYRSASESPENYPIRVLGCRSSASGYNIALPRNRPSAKCRSRAMVVRPTASAYQRVFSGELKQRIQSGTAHIYYGLSRNICWGRTNRGPGLGSPKKLSESRPCIGRKL